MAKILVVDNDLTIRVLPELVLVEQGHEVIQAKNGEEAITATYLHWPNLILMDIDMPVLDGFKAILQVAGIPVIMLGGTPIVDGEKLVMWLGVKYFVPKPWEPEALEATVRAAPGVTAPPFLNLLNRRTV